MDLLKILDTKPVPSIVDSTTLGISGNVSGDYWLPIPMCLYQKQLTDQIVSLHYSDILRFFETKNFNHFSNLIIKSLIAMCNNNELIATHPFLLIDHFFNKKNLTNKDYQLNLIENSGKFKVLKDLILTLQDYETDTAIIAKSGRTLDLLESLLLSLKVNIIRYDGQSIIKNNSYNNNNNLTSNRNKNFSCTCHLFPSDDYNSKEYPILANLQFNCLLLIDPTININKKSFLDIRNYGKEFNDKSITPIIRLTTINSIEHCKLYFQSVLSNKKKFNDCFSNLNLIENDTNNNNSDNIEYLTNITAATVVLRDRVGILPPDLRPIYSQKLIYLIPWIENTSLPWPLPDLYTIKKFNSTDVEISLLTEVYYKQVEDELEEAFGDKSNNNTNNNKKRKTNNTINATNNNKKNEKLISKVPSFYSIRRLKNNYSTNPLKQKDSSLLTGIKKIDSNQPYHLSTGILTHKLIQEIGQIYIEYNLKQFEIQSYDKLSTIEQDHLNHYLIENNKINSDLTERLEKNESNILKSDCLLEENKNFLIEIDNLKIDINKLTEILKDKNPPLSIAFLDNISVIQDLQNKRSQYNSSLSQNNYLTDELNKATNSKNDSENEIYKLQNQMVIHQQNILQKVETSLNDNSIREQNEQLRSLIDIENEKLIKLKEKLNKLTKDLDNLPLSRLRNFSKSSSKKGRNKRKRN